MVRHVGQFRLYRRHLLVFLAVVLFMIYATLPIAAGYFAIGDRRGPRIYPLGWHRAFYIIGWEGNPQRVGKPRHEFPSWSTPRPWFYGM